MNAYFNDNKEQAFSHIEEQHFPDTYKKPNHPTFSDESIYSTQETPGGHWDNQNGKDVFYPSEWQIETFGTNYILNGMQQQGDSNVVPVRMDGIMLPEIDVQPQQVDQFASGGNIHIKPENRGKFTALKERTGKSSIWYKEHGTPEQKKMATFALNARKWKHANGGYLDNLTTKPFSYQPIPEVRYKKGGFLKRTIDLLGSLFGLDQDETQQSEGIDLREIAARQAYAESGFDSNAKSNAGAMGLFQIMPSVLQDYNTKNNNTIPTDSLVNDSINTDVRNWYMGDLMNREWNTKNNPSDSVRVAKALGAYNWGSGNLVKALNKAKADGIDIYNSWDWLSYLAPETRDYIDFILMGNNNSLHRNNVAYKSKSKQNQEKVDKIKNSFDEGGNLELDQQYANQMYEQGLQQALDLGYTGINAANFALNNAINNLQFDAGQLPEFTVTANKPDNIHYIKDDTRPGINRVTYNANQAKQYEREAQRNASIVGGMIGAPMLAVGAAPVAEMYAGSMIGPELYDLAVKGTTKVGNAMNILFPGTTEFMNLYNSGKLGKTLALGLAGLEAGTEFGLINDFIYNPSVQSGAEAALGIGATVGAGTSAVARGIDAGTNLLGAISKPIRDWKLALQLQYNADKMILNGKINKAKKMD